MMTTIKNNLNKRLNLMIELTQKYPSINIDDKYSRDTNKDKLTNWTFKNKTLEYFVDKIESIDNIKLKEYAIKRLYNIKMSEAMEYLIVLSTTNSYKCSPYDKLGDVVIESIKYDVKCISTDWSGTLYRNYNSKYIYITYKSKYDFINIDKLKEMSSNIKLSKFNGDNETYYL